MSILTTSTQNFALSDQSKEVKEILKDLKIKVINLERSPQRWEGVTNTFAPLEISYERFNAIDGYKILLIDQNTKKQFSGADLKNKIAQLELDHKYEIICDPENSNPTTFNWSYLREQPFSPGLFGIYCSNFVIHREIVKDDLPYAIICEDDIRIKPNNFLKNLALYVKNIPSNFDLAYVGVYRDNDNVVEINPYVNQFAPDNG